MYEIHACQPGSICDLSCAVCQHQDSKKSSQREPIRIKILVLVVYPSRPHYCFVNTGTVEKRTIASLHGSSSARFSKYLLPYRSVAIRVPALVSPTPSINSYSTKIVPEHIPMYCRKRTTDQLCIRNSPRWTLDIPAFDGHIPVTRESAASLQDVRPSTNLQTNPAQVAKRSQNCRHPCVVTMAFDGEEDDVEGGSASPNLV